MNSVSSVCVIAEIRRVTDGLFLAVVRKESEQSVEHIRIRSEDCSIFLDILPIITAIAFFPQKFRYSGYCRQWCTHPWVIVYTAFFREVMSTSFCCTDRSNCSDQIRCLAFVSFNVLCITVCDDIGNDQQPKEQIPSSRLSA